MSRVVVFQTPQPVIDKIRAAYNFAAWMDQEREWWSVTVNGHNYHGFRTNRAAKKAGESLLVKVFA